MRILTIVLLTVSAQCSSGSKTIHKVQMRRALRQTNGGFPGLNWLQSGGGGNSGGTGANWPALQNAGGSGGASRPLGGTTGGGEGGGGGPQAPGPTRSLEAPPSSNGPQPTGFPSEPPPPPSSSSPSSSSGDAPSSGGTSPGSDSSPLSSNSSDGGGGSGEGNDAVLKLHNDYRAKHGAPPLVWSNQVASTAQNWANGCKFQHSQGSGYGENLGMGHQSFEECVKAWYDEVSQFNAYGQDSAFSSGTGHFTQVVWKATKELGCGVAKDCSGGPLYVCNYSPPGNVMGSYAANVSPPK